MRQHPLFFHHYALRTYIGLGPALLSGAMLSLGLAVEQGRATRAATKCDAAEMPPTQSDPAELKRPHVEAVPTPAACGRIAATETLYGDAALRHAHKRLRLDLASVPGYNGVLFRMPNDGYVISDAHMALHNHGGKVFRDFVGAVTATRQATKLDAASMRTTTRSQPLQIVRQPRCGPRSKYVPRGGLWSMESAVADLHEAADARVYRIVQPSTAQLTCSPFLEIPVVDPFDRDSWPVSERDDRELFDQSHSREAEARRERDRVTVAWGVPTATASTGAWTPDQFGRMAAAYDHVRLTTQEPWHQD